MSQLATGCAVQFLTSIKRCRRSRVLLLKHMFYNVEFVVRLCAMSFLEISVRVVQVYIESIVYAYGEQSDTVATELVNADAHTQILK